MNKNTNCNISIVQIRISGNDSANSPGDKVEVAEILFNHC